MKKFLVLLILVSSIAAAQTGAIISQREIPTEQLRVNTFGELIKHTAYSLAANEHATPQTVAATGAASVGYLDGIKGPLMLRIQNSGTNGLIYFKPYSISTAGVASTTNTDAYLPTAHLATGTAGQLTAGEVYEKVFFKEPNLIFGGVNAATFTIQVYTQSK